ncbi:MAG: hypothetical protein ACTSU2_13290 [Promethearchaeota archaeon]
MELEKLKKLIKKRGFHETITLLYGARNASMLFSDFFDKLKELNSYYNAFLRVKQSLEDYNIITYKKSRTGKKIISLTPNGILLAKHLRQIEELLSNPYEKYVEIQKKRMRKISKQKRTLMRKRMANLS